jgi:hypothetical protein
MPKPPSPIGDLLAQAISEQSKLETPIVEPSETKAEKSQSKLIALPAKYKTDEELDTKLWNISAFYLKNLRPINKPITFERYGLDAMDYNAHPTPKPIRANAPDSHIYAECYFKDEVDKGQEKRMYLSSRTQKIKVNGEFIVEPIVDTIEFSKGRFTVNPFKDFKTYVFLMLNKHNANGINPNKGQFLFQRVVKPKASFGNTPEGIEAMIDALMLIKAASSELVIFACEKLSIEFPNLNPYNKNPSDLRTSLSLLAKRMPKEVLEALGDEESLCRFYVKTAVSEGYLKYSSTNRIWTMDDVLNEPIDPVRVSPEKDETEVMVDFLLTNTHIYECLIDSIRN